MSESAEAARATERDPAGGSGWTRLLRGSAIAAIVVVVIVNVVAGIIPPLLVFAAVWVGGVIWLRRATRGPAILLLVGFIAFLGLSAPFILPTLTVPASAGDFILNVASAVAALVGIVAAVAVLRRRTGPSGAPRAVALAAVGLFVVATVFSIVSFVTYEDATQEQGDVTLVAKDIEFQDTSLSASSGEVSVFVENKDSTLHTFTIDELDVSLDIPAGKKARVTFDAEPGSYEFYCIPHEGDMEGTLQID